MWAELKHPGHVAFYERLQHGRYDPAEDWTPMIQAVQYLQAQPYAERLFAFTSLMHFHVTTAESYGVFDRHLTVGITWAVMEQRFRLSIGNSWTEDREGEVVCEGHEFPWSVEPLMERLLLSAE